MSVRGLARSAGAQVTKLRNHGVRGLARSAGAQVTKLRKHGVRGLARSAGAQVTKVRNHAPGRPKGEYRSAPHEGSPVSAAARCRSPETEE